MVTSTIKPSFLHLSEVFILGMLLAKLRQLLDKKAVASQHGAPPC